jgi:hypothetical protein
MDQRLVYREPVAIANDLARIAATLDGEAAAVVAAAATLLRQAAPQLRVVVMQANAGGE